MEMGLQLTLKLLDIRDLVVWSVDSLPQVVTPSIPPSPLSQSFIDGRSGFHQIIHINNKLMI
jgi:hypothetical protein